jgi:nucleotide-binding universal stress UspA family protein
MFGTIVVGADGLDKGRGALRRAHGLAELTGDRIRVVSVLPDPGGPPPLPALDLPRARDEAGSRLAALRDELAPGADAEVTVGDSVAHALRDVVDRERAGLVVVGSAQRRGRARLMEGDRAMQVMEGAPCAVLLVPEDERGRPALRRIVVGIERTPEAEAALGLAAALARRSGAELRLVAAVDETPLALGLWGYPGPVVWDDVAEALTAAGEELVAEAVARSGVAGAVGAAIHGPAARVLIDASAEADLLVLGSRRWGTLRRVVLGSTTAGVLRETRCAVLVPPRDGES